jgi:hypothetical protein
VLPFGPKGVDVYLSGALLVPTTLGGVFVLASTPWSRRERRGFRRVKEL